MTQHTLNLNHFNTDQVIQLLRNILRTRTRTYTHARKQSRGWDSLHRALLLTGRRKRTSAQGGIGCRAACGVLGGGEGAAGYRCICWCASSVVNGCGCLADVCVICRCRSLLVIVFAPAHWRSQRASSLCRGICYPVVSYSFGQLRF